MQNITFNFKQFIIIVLITSIWINISEVFRYFVFVIPAIKAYWQGMEQIANMDLMIFSIWGFWDTLLTAVLVFICWMFMQIFGSAFKSIFASATITWLAVFVIFWVAASNMGLSNWSILLIALPLSWFEMLVGAWLASRLYASGRWT